MEFDFVRIFLDTNVLVSAFATRGLSTDVLRVILAEHQLVTGEVVLTELSRILEKKIKLPPQKIAEIDIFMRSFEIIDKPKKVTVIELNDQSDRYVLQSAINGGCDLLITGDNDLLSVSNLVKEITIVSPRSFWEFLRNANAGN